MPPRPRADWTGIPVKQLNLSSRAFNAVTRGAGIRTIGELAARSDDNLRNCAGIGLVTLREIRLSVRRFMTERGADGDITGALTRASLAAGCDMIDHCDALAIIEALAQEGWEIRRV